jgi:hypothetical protein
MAFLATAVLEGPMWIPVDAFDGVRDHRVRPAGRHLLFFLLHCMHPRAGKVITPTPQHTYAFYRVNHSKISCSPKISKSLSDFDN